MDAVTLAAANASAAKKRWAASQPRLIPVTGRGFTQYQVLSNGTDTSATSRTQHIGTANGGQVRLVYANVQGNGGNNPQGQFDGPNTISVRASIEVGSQLYPVFFNGQRTATLDPGAVLVSDPCGVAMNAGGTFYVRSYVSVTTAGMKWGAGYSCNSGNGEGVTVGTDLTPVGSGAVTATSVQVFSPWAVLGEPVAPAPAVCIMGDSIANGSRDVGTTPQPKNMGAIERALLAAGGIGFYKISQPGEMANNFAATALRRHREFMFGFCTDVVCNYGRNDVTQSRTLAQIQADLITCWTAAARRRPRIWQTTITPVTTSTDSWATTTNQTSASNDAVRVTLNAWIRDGAPTLNGAAVATGSSAAGTVRAGQAGHLLAGWFEQADYVETARDSGIWKAGYCFDGTHPNDTGYQAMQAGIPTAKFTV